MTEPKPIEGCRICGGTDLAALLDLGEQALTGVFPHRADEPVASGPLELVRCGGCGLVQLRHTCDLHEMYGATYGYRSGLNASMVAHLQGKAVALEGRFGARDGDVVLDIGSNDATLLRAYRTAGLRRLGIDPVGAKFARFYTDGAELAPEFFSAAAYRARQPRAQAKLVTSIGMFYDLEEPRAFVRDVAAVLADDGVWHFEQSYLPAMLRRNAYDTICHEHLEYYTLGVVQRLLAEAGLRVLEVEMNDTNGGSFAVTAAKAGAPWPADEAGVARVLEAEAALELATLRPFREFAARVRRHREELRATVAGLRAEGKTIAGCGASTKGNVVLQYCGFGPAEIACIAEVNEDKFGAFTPGTRIPIRPEAEVRASRPDCLLVLPWHFRESILRRERKHRARGGKIIFPLPEIEIV